MLSVVNSLPCECSKGHIFRLRIMKHGQNVCLDEISDKFENGSGVPRGLVVRCLTRNPGVLGSSRTTSSGFLRGSVLGQDTSEPSLILVKPRKA